MEEPVNYYDEYKNHITSKLSNEISKLFNVLKQDTISSKEVKHTILVLSTNVYEYLNNCKDDKVYNFIEELTNIEYEINLSIKELILYKSKKIIESFNPVVLLLELIMHFNS